jgi:hypothetical protein
MHLEVILELLVSVVVANVGESGKPNLLLVRTPRHRAPGELRCEVHVPQHCEQYRLMPLLISALAQRQDPLRMVLSGQRLWRPVVN